MRTIYFFIVVVAASILLASCKKDNGSSVVANYSMTASITDPVFPTDRTFISDTCSATNTTISGFTPIIITANNIVSTSSWRGIYIEIEKYTGLGNYVIINDSLKFIVLTQVFPSSGTAITYMSADKGTISISSMSAASIGGTFNVSVGPAIFSGAFYVPIKN